LIKRILMAQGSNPRAYESRPAQGADRLEQTGAMACDQ